MPKKTEGTGSPKFPYTTEPKALRRLLAEIPKRPKPPRLTLDLIKSWNVSKNNNARTTIPVLKKLGLLGEGGDPTNTYTEFMKTGTGPAVLAERIKDVYKPLFDASHAPQSESDDQLKSLFNINSGGGEDAMRLQVQTFKALCEYANFAGGPAAVVSTEKGVGPITGALLGGSQQLPPVQVDLHIHLPENKTTRDYEAIIQDIAKYIYGRDIDKA